jgi:hypothetical protein
MNVKEWPVGMKTVDIGIVLSLIGLYKVKCEVTEIKASKDKMYPVFFRI